MSLDLPIYADNRTDFQAGSGTSPCSAPLFSSPIPSTTKQYVYQQDFMCFIDNFAPLLLNTLSPYAFTDPLLYAGYVLVEESERKPDIGGLCRWTRTYARVPDAWSEQAGNTSYHFIGWGVQGLGVQRAPFPRTVPVRIQRDYFLVGAPPATYSTDSQIPFFQEQTYYGQNLPNNFADYIADSPPLAIATTPSLTAYKALITANAEIICEASTVTRWKGNIFVRETRFIHAL